MSEIGVADGRGVVSPAVWPVLRHTQRALDDGMR